MTGCEDERADGDRDSREPMIQTVVREEVRIEGILKISDRGAITIPRVVRDKLDIGRGGKLLVVTVTRTGTARMIILIPANCLGEEK